MISIVGRDGSGSSFRAEVQGGDLLLDRVARQYDDDPRRAVAPQRRDQLYPVAVGKPQVEQDQTI